MTVEPTVLKAGSKAYLDALRTPLMTVVVVEVLTPGESHRARVRVRVTARKPHPAYKTGEVFEAPGSSVVPRSHVYLSRGQYWIKGIPVRFE